MSIVLGKYAMILRSNLNRYEEGVWHLARMIERILSYAHFYNRLTDQLINANLSDLDYEQVRYSQIACYDVAVIDLHKLVESKKDTWNFDQLFKEWKKYEHHKEKQNTAKNSISDLRKALASQIEYRHEKVAHQSKRIKPTNVTVLPTQIDYLQDVVNLMDIFVDGPINYTLYLHNANQELDLRKLLALK